MVSKTSKKKAAVTLPSIPKEVIDQMVNGPMTAEAINATSMAFKKALIERALGEAIDLALGILPDDTRDILGLWIENTEGAKFWMKVFNDLKTRGVADILIAVTDGLKGMPEALAAVFPATTQQTCIVHLIRNRLDDASWKDRKALAAAIKPIDTAPSAEAALAELDSCRVLGARNSPPWRLPGGGHGTGSSPSLPSQRRSAGSSTRPMPSKASTPGGARSSRRAGISRATMPRSS
jgi:hypothetical protein